MKYFYQTILAATLTSAMGVGCAGAQTGTRAENDSQQSLVRDVHAGEITVSGKATVRIPADMANVRFGVVSISQDPEQARAENAEVARATMNAVRSLGIDEGKIKLETLRLEPNREYDPGTRRYLEKGFQAVRRISVRVEDLDLLPRLTADIVHLGANRISGISYALIDDRAAELDALDQALVNARDKAERMAATMKTGLGRILRISEEGVVSPQPVVQFERALTAKAMDAGQARPDAFSSGEIEITARVVVVFSLAHAHPANQ